MPPSQRHRPAQWSASHCVCFVILTQTLSKTNQLTGFHRSHSIGGNRHCRVTFSARSDPRHWKAFPLTLIRFPRFNGANGEARKMLVDVAVSLRHHG